MKYIFIIKIIVFILVKIKVLKVTTLSKQLIRQNLQMYLF